MSDNGGTAGEMTDEGMTERFEAWWVTRNQTMNPRLLCMAAWCRASARASAAAAAAVLPPSPVVAKKAAKAMYHYYKQGLVDDLEPNFSAWREYHDLSRRFEEIGDAAPVASPTPAAPKPGGVLKLVGPDPGLEGAIAAANQLAPACSICGAVATQRDIDGNWWPPCGHAKSHGIDTLKYPAPAAEAPTPAEARLREELEDVGRRNWGDDWLAGNPADDGPWAAKIRAALAAPPAVAEAPAEAREGAARAATQIVETVRGIIGRVRADSSYPAGELSQPWVERLIREASVGWDAAMEEAAKVAEALDRCGREWVQDSLWANVKADTARAIRALKSPARPAADHIASAGKMVARPAGGETGETETKGGEAHE